MWHAKVVLAALVAQGCASPLDISSFRFVTPPEAADSAGRMLDIAFEISEPLPVYWVAGDCWDSVGFMYGDRCIFGITFDDAIVIPHPGPGVPVSSTGLGHEKAHNRWGDSGHALRHGVTESPVWGADPRSDYEAGTRVGDGNAAIIAAGL